MGARVADAAAFAAAAAKGWAEWAGTPPTALEGAPGVAVAPDRTLLAGDLQRLAAAGCGGDRELADWLGGLAPYPEVPGVPLPVRCGPYALHFGIKTYVVAILNRTRDSFSEERPDLPGVDELVERAWAAYASGADIVDLGAESSLERDQGGLSPAVEADRLRGVVAALADLPAIISLDTRRGGVARELLGLRPMIINDVDALADASLAACAAEAGAPVVLMRAASLPAVGDPLPAVTAELAAALERAQARGVAWDQCILDAGFGFGTTSAQDLEVTRRLGEVRRLGRPLLHAPCRKRAIGAVLGFPESIPERLAGTAAAVTAGIAAGVDLVRVHDLPFLARVARMSDAFYRGTGWRDIVAP